MYPEVSNYRKFVASLPSRIKESSFKPSKLIEKTGISKATFYKKLKTNSFSIDEVEKISKVLFVEALIDAGIRKGEQDIAAGRVYEGKAALEKLRKQLQERV